jgi:hypothetical protein
MIHAMSLEDLKPSPSPVFLAGLLVFLAALVYAATLLL